MQSYGAEGKSRAETRNSAGCGLAFVSAWGRDDFIAAASMLPGVQLAACAASSSLERSKEFAQRHGFKRAHASYPELAADPDVGALCLNRALASRLVGLVCAVSGWHPRFALHLESAPASTMCAAVLEASLHW